MNKNLIAILYEGEKTERLVFDSIKKLFFPKKGNLVMIHMPLAHNIYMLWSRLEKDDFQTDIIEVARELTPTAQKALAPYTRDDFSEVYLFLDHDAHAESPDQGHAVIVKMLKSFDNETENGKLYISYPMIEAIRDVIKDDACYRRCAADIADNTNYKRSSAERSDFSDLKKHDDKSWALLAKHAVKKARCIVLSGYTIPTYTEFTENLSQAQIYHEQSEKYIRQGKVGILSAIPLFLLEYYDETFWNRMIRDDT